MLQHNGKEISHGAHQNQSMSLGSVDDIDELMYDVQHDTIDKDKFVAFRKWCVRTSANNNELYTSLIRYMILKSTNLYEKHCEFLEKAKHLITNHQPNQKFLEPEVAVEEIHGRHWDADKWTISLTKELGLFDPNNPKRHNPLSANLNTAYLKRNPGVNRYRRFFDKYPALFYIYKYTFFSGTITQITEILESNIDLKKKAEYIPNNFKIW